MTAREVLKAIRKAARRAGLDVSERSSKGSHRLVTVGTCRTTVAVHPGDVPTGTLRSIERDLAPCLGERWMR